MKKQKRKPHSKVRLTQSCEGQGMNTKMISMNNHWQKLGESVSGSRFDIFGNIFESNITYKDRDTIIVGAAPIG